MAELVSKENQAPTAGGSAAQDAKKPSQAAGSASSSVVAAAPVQDDDGEMSVEAFLKAEYARLDAALQAQGIEEVSTSHRAP
jgi:hypothetical protein